MENISLKITKLFICFFLLLLVITACTQQPKATVTVPPTSPKATNTPTLALSTATSTQVPQASKTSQSTPTTATSPSTGKEGISKNIRLDPAIVFDEDSNKISSRIYEGLVRLNSNGEVEGALAREWTISEDKLDYIFYLRTNVTFHDGTPLNADMVLANFNRWFDPKDILHGNNPFDTWKSLFLGFKGDKKSDGSPLSSFDGIEKVDNFTVLVHINRIDENLLKYLANPAFSILNPTLLKSKGTDYGTMNGGAVGTGPYIIEKWTGDNLVLVPYKNYWDPQSIPVEAIDYILK